MKAFLTLLVLAAISAGVFALGSLRKASTDKPILHVAAEVDLGITQPHLLEIAEDADTQIAICPRHVTDQQRNDQPDSSTAGQAHLRLPTRSIENPAQSEISSGERPGDHGSHNPVRERHQARQPHLPEPSPGWLCA